jgi:hypothetical protein
MGPARIHVGLLSGFRGAATLLMTVDADGVRSLAKLFATMSEPSAIPLNLESDPRVVLHCDLQLELAYDPEDSGLRCAAGRAIRLRWARDRDGWLEVAEKTAALGPTPSHTYLNAAHRSEPYVVMVSLSEYDNTWWSSRGADVG